LAQPIDPHIPKGLILPSSTAMQGDFLAKYTPSPHDGKFATDLLFALQNHLPLTTFQKFFIYFVVFIPVPLDWKLSFFNFFYSSQRTLLCLIFPRGLRWNGSTYLNTEISQCYRAIMDLREPDIRYGGPSPGVLEHLFRICVGVGAGVKENLFLIIVHLQIKTLGRSEIN
jgi:hypothetical protein